MHRDVNDIIVFEGLRKQISCTPRAEAVQVAQQHGLKHSAVYELGVKQLIDGKSQKNEMHQMRQNIAKYQEKIRELSTRVYKLEAGDAS